MDQQASGVVLPGQNAPAEEPVEQEIPFAPGADIDIDQPTPVTESVPSEGTSDSQESEQKSDDLDDLVPKKEPHTWHIGPADIQRTFVQKPLSFLGKMQWFALVGGVLDKALSGPNGMSVNSLLDTPGRGPTLTLADFRDADMFIQAVGKLLAAAPTFLEDSYMIWLNVPDYDREVVREMMKLPPDEGGLSDEDGIEIIEVFIDQNYEALADFFGKRLSKLGRRVSKLQQDRASR